MDSPLFVHLGGTGSDAQFLLLHLWRYAYLQQMKLHNSETETESNDTATQLSLDHAISVKHSKQKGKRGIVFWWVKEMSA